MISPETLRRFPFFSFLNAGQIDKVAMLAEEIPINKGDSLFDTGQPADALYLLVSGEVELSTESYDKYYKPELRRNYLIGEINRGEVFGLSSLIPPYELTASAMATADCEVLKLNAREVRKLMAADPLFAAGLLQEVAKALMERLNYTRIQLAAARN